MKITNHWLDEANMDELEGGSEMPIRRCLVYHFTGGAGAKSSIQSMRERGLSAHLVVERDGTIYQCRPFNRRCAHAGVSRWVDPKTGKKYGGANEYSLGIEMANAGNDKDALNWARKQPGFSSLKAKHRNGGELCEWECFPQAQFNAVLEIAKLLVETYHLDDITGHDAIAPERKDDPGPAFNIQAIRGACGFSGLPEVHFP